MIQTRDIETIMDRQAIGRRLRRLHTARTRIGLRLRIRLLRRYGLLFDRSTAVDSRIVQRLSGMVAGNGGHALNVAEIGRHQQLREWCKVTCVTTGDAYSLPKR